MEQIEHELLELSETMKQVEAQLEKLRREEASLRKRQEIALRLLRRGHDPNLVLELSQEGLAELERRLKKLELAEEAQRARRGLNWFISSLLRNPAQQKACQLPLPCHGLDKDPLRLRRVRKASLEKECNELTIQLGWIKNQIQIVMGYEDSEDQITRLEDSKAQIEKELRQKQEELARLTRQIQEMEAP